MAGTRRSRRNPTRQTEVTVFLAALRDKEEQAAQQTVRCFGANKRCISFPMLPLQPVLLLHNVLLIFYVGIRWQRC